MPPRILQRSLALLAVVFAVTAAAQHVAKLDVVQVEPTILVRGAKVSMLVALPDLADDAHPDAIIHLDEVGSRATHPLPALLLDDLKTVQFDLPDIIPLGRYTLRLNLRIGKETHRYGVNYPSGVARIRQSDRVALRSVEPGTVLPRDNSYSFQLLGSGFSPIARENIIYLDGRQIFPCSTQGRCPQVEVLSTNSLAITGVSPSWGAVRVAPVRVVVDERSSNAVEIRLAGFPKATAKWVAVGLAVLWLCLVTLGASLATTRRSNGGTKLSWWRLLLYDARRNELSAVNFQWHVLVLGAVVLLGTAAVRKLSLGEELLWHIILLVAMLFLVPSLTVAAWMYLGAKTWPNKATEPHLADLIRAGGLFAPHRLLLVVASSAVGALAILVAFSSRVWHAVTGPWSIGVAVLLLATTIGYLAQEMTWARAPVIESITATRWPFAVSIRGRHIGRGATFEIDNMRIRAAPGDAEVDPDSATVQRRDDERERPTVHDILFSFKSPRPDWMWDEHDFCVVNPDGQRNCVKFAAKWDQEEKTVL